MLSPEDVSFDVLKGQSEPFSGFGRTYGNAEGFASVSLRARERISQTFGFEDGGVQAIAARIDGIIEEMWSEGWNPAEADVDLFVTDFGAALADTIIRDLGGEPVFRSTTDLTHMSVWWRERKLETFPFHKVFKRLTRPEGEGLVFYVEGLSRLLS